MNVLLLCHDYKPPFLTLAGQSAKMFKNSSYQVTTVYLKGAPNDEVVRQSYADEVVFLNLSAKQMHGLKLRAIYEILKLHKRKHFDLALTHRYQALYIATHIPGLQVIGTHHDFIEYQRWSRRFWVMFHQKRLFLLGVSNAVRDSLRQSLPKFPQEHIQTLYNSIEPDNIRATLLSRETARQALGISDHFWFVNVGALLPLKDQATLIHGFAIIAAEIPDGRLAIIGTGPCLEELKALVQEKNLADRVILMGQIKGAYQYLRAFDSLVLSSKSESFGMVLLEAMMAGLPIVATSCGGIPEVLGDTGWLVASKDISQLAEKMKAVYCLDETSRKQTQQKMAQRVIDNFSTDPVRKQLMILIQSLSLPQDDTLK